MFKLSKQKSKQIFGTFYFEVRYVKVSFFLVMLNQILNFEYLTVFKSILAESLTKLNSLHFQKLIP